MRRAKLAVRSEKAGTVCVVFLARLSKGKRDAGSLPFLGIFVDNMKKYQKNAKNYGLF